MGFDVIASAVTGLCIFGLFVAVVMNFASDRPRAFQERRSAVATASMTAFGVLVYATIRFRWSMLPVAMTPAILTLRACGLAILMAGTAFNIWGRLWLKGNWADQVRVYADQTLVTGGPYRFVRHPLYASLIWMIYGAALAYLNPLAALENAIIFVPAMIYRARQEEAMLEQRFGEAYILYKRRTGRFLPYCLPRREGSKTHV